MKVQKTNVEPSNTRKNNNPSRLGVNMPDALQIWKRIDDELVPRLQLSVTDRSAYSYLLRHSRLEGKRQLQFSVPSLARGIRRSDYGTRQAMRRLIDLGALRIVERTTSGHTVEVLLPDEIRAASELAPAQVPRIIPLDEMDFLRVQELRQAIHARECGQCFYCLRKLAPEAKCLDHVVPRFQFGRDSYRNLVSCCVECNSQKGETSGEQFLRWLYRERRLTATELTARLRALDALAAGKLKPAIEATSK